jgi:2-succinyl-5-enolpyruvyl-6-hydroxy-3-cyclohexene-1-carboxylate synthase
VSVATGGPESADAGAVQATFAATVVDEWVRRGVRAAVVCPGSRSTPLALALAGRPELSLHVRLDERGAGFFAIGLAVATGRPVVVCTTSGTAAAELHPAVVEAHHGRVPLLVCTADRPPELHDVGAPQTIDQHALYGSAVRWAVDPGPPEPGAAGTWRSLADRALAESSDGPAGPGPVHLNLAFREPLVGRPGPLPPGPPGPTFAPSAARRPPAPGSVAALRALAGRRGVVVAGAGAGRPAAVLALARALGWPLLADPRSGCRSTEAEVVAAPDAFLRDPVVAAALGPEAVVVLGSPWSSKVLAGWLAAAAGSGADVVAVDPWWRWVDPDRVVGLTLRDDPTSLVDAVLSTAGALHPAPGGWLRRWQAVEAAAQRAVDAALGLADGRPIDRGAPLTEPLIGRLLLGLVPDGTRVVAASSMPVRDLEWFSAPLDRPPPVHANRGANGIDGVCSTALGMAAAGDDVIGLVGDLAFLHDVSALVGPATAGPGAAGPGSCTIVVVDNGGGGIFSFLPQAAALAPERFEALFGTPQAPDVASVAGGFGVPTDDVGTLAELESSLGALVGRVPLGVVRARVPDRRANVALHDGVVAAVASAARAAAG